MAQDVRHDRGGRGTSLAARLTGPRSWVQRFPERFVYRTDARTRRTLNFWLLLLWLIPGTIVWILLRDALWFVGFMSIYAIWATHWAGWSAETPAEVEEEPPTEG